MRSYNSDIADKIKRINYGARIDVIAYDHGLPVYVVEAGPRYGEAMGVSVLHHGEEPAPADAVIRFLDRPHKRRIIAFPCLNPTGYERNSRLTADGVNLNTEYYDTCAPVIKAVKRVIASIDDGFNEWYDLHEDMTKNKARGFPRSANPRRCYASETSRWPRGHALLDYVRMAGFPTTTRKRIYTNRAKNGLIWMHPYDPNYRDEDAMEGFASHKVGVKESQTFETPTCWSWEDRVGAHLAFLEAVENRVHMKSVPHIPLNVRVSRLLLERHAYRYNLRMAA